jgi:ATP phosphoribosyltransferase regulatory subunit
LIGLDSVAAAREVVAVAIEALEAAGVRGLTIDFTLPDLVDTLAADALPLAADEIEAVRARLDAKDAGGLDGAGAAYLPLIEAAGPFATAVARLRAFDAKGALASRLDGLEAIAASIGDRATLTLDPTERHGFEYQSWLGFSIFADGVSGEIGRGGSYTIVHDSGEEPAVGFSLYIDPLVDTGLATAPRRRLFVPLGADVSVAERLRGEGWVTVCGLTPDDSAEKQICTHVLVGGMPQPL